MTAPNVLRRAALVAVLAAAVALLGATAASAHIQISPTVAAPNDPVQVTVLVPGEREQETTRVELKVPAGVLPFSFGTTPGWKRTLVEAKDGSIDRIVWTGRMPSDGFATFSFLAGTPETATTLTWKALQTYSDGAITRWIGAPGSERPAPTTRIVPGTPPQNAGGEGGAGAESGAAAPAAAASAAVRPGDDGPDWVARGLALAGLFVGLMAVVLALRSRPSGR